MEIEFDHEKDEINRRTHGVSLAAATDMDFDTALVVTDERFDYGETRFQSLGLIGGRLHMLAFTLRGRALRAISLRIANQRERRRYETRER